MPPTSLPTRAELRGFDPLEPRDPHGKWISGGSLAGDLDTVRKRNPRVQLEVHPTVNAERPTARLSLIRTAEGDRGKGHAEKAMRDLTAVADRHGTTLTLTPEPLAGDRKTSKARLTEFYKRHGFVENKGRGRDLSISDSMYRPPRGGTVRAEKNVLLNLGTPDEEKPGKVTPRVAAFVSKGVATATSLVGGKSSSWKSTVTMPEKGNEAVLGVMDWDGTMRLREDVARKLDQYLAGGEIADPDVFEVVLHELLHSVGQKPVDERSYQSSLARTRIEEGFTELGAADHLAAFTRAMGVGDRPTPMLAQPLHDDASGHSAHATMSELADRFADPGRLTSGSSWGHYASIVNQAEAWCMTVAAAEGLPGGDKASRDRLVQLADEINAVGVADKPNVMASQVLRALGIPPGDVIPDSIASAVLGGWESADTDGGFAAASQLAKSQQKAIVARRGGNRSYDASRAEGRAARRVGVPVPGVAGSRRAAPGQPDGGQRVGPGAAGSAGRWPDPVEAGGLMYPRSLPPRPPERRNLFDPSRHPRGEHGKFVDEIGKELKAAEADIRHPRSRAPAAPAPATVAAKVADAVKPLADFHQYSATFTPAQDAAAQLATKRALLAFSQKRILDSLNTPPEDMTPDQIAIATRVVGKLTGTQISEHVDRLRTGGVPAPVVDHVHGKLTELRADLAKEQNADARQKIITHVAAIVAAVALTLGTMGLAIPAALAAIIAAFPALSQEFIDFKADYTTKHAAKKAAAAAVKTAGRSLGTVALALIELRRDPAELRTAETPIVSTVHHPFGSPAGPGLFRVKGLQLPAYIQNVAHAFTRTGTPESEAIQRAIGVVQDWAAGRTPNGKGHVHPDVQAAAARAIAEWEAAKAAAHGSK